ATDSLANDLGEGGGGRGDKKASRLGEDLERPGKEPVNLRVNGPGEALERGHRVVVMGGEPATDVEELQLKASGLCLRNNSRSEVQRLNIVLWVGTLTAYVEAQPLDFEFVIVRKGN